LTGIESNTTSFREIESNEKFSKEAGQKTDFEQANTTMGG